MRSVSKDQVAFAVRAEQAFKANPKLQSYTDRNIESGEPLALRWNNTCILVIMVGIDEPCLFTELEDMTNET